MIRSVHRRVWVKALAAAPLALAVPGLRAFEAERPITENMAGPYVPTPWVIVDEMIKLADVRATDTVYDLGSGDGRLVIAAAKRHGARGVGVEYQAKLVEFSRVQARQDGVAQRVRFVQGDLFDTDLSPASVVTLYLLPKFVERLVPKLRAELAPGSRVVSHDYALNPWPPEKTLIFDVEEKQNINGTTRTSLFYYVVPARVGGRWSLQAPAGWLPEGTQFSLRQAPDALEGRLHVPGAPAQELRELNVRATAVRFGLLHGGRLMSFRGTVKGEGLQAVMEGELSEARGERVRWSARRIDTAQDAPAARP